MKKIIVVGRSGVGKSTFAKKLHNITNIPIYHLDQFLWNEDKSQVSEEVFLKRLNEAVNKDEWIIDGDYSSSYRIRFDACDTVFFLDLPVELSISGVQSRVGIKRDDLPWAEEELTEEFKDYILSWDNNVKEKLLSLLDEYKENRNIIVFKSREESNKYLEKLSKFKK